MKAKRSYQKSKRKKKANKWLNRESIETESSKVTKGKGSHWGRDRHRMLTNHNEREKSTLACPYSFYSSIPTMRGKKTITERLSGEEEERQGIIIIKKIYGVYYF